jgi:catechol 2,3-dioxygenase
MTTTDSASRSALDPVLAHAPHRIGAVGLTVRDLDRVAQYYRDVIGLQVLRDEGSNVTLGAGATPLLVLREDKAATVRSPRDAGLFHTAFLLPDRADLSAWLRHIAQIQAPIQGASDHLVSEAVYLADPEGNGIEVYRDRMPAEWPVRDGEFQMATEPLDLQALLRSDPARAWSGFPAGGTVGHVHLQVGALGPAEDFYRGLLGLGVTCRYPGAVFFGSGGYHHQLAGNIWNSRGAPVRAQPSTGLADVELVVAPEVVRSARQTIPHLADEAGRLAVQDPWGTRVTLVERDASSQP